MSESDPRKTKADYRAEAEDLLFGSYGAQIHILTAERDRYRSALEVLLRFGERLMESEDDGERLIGTNICEGARVLTDV